MAIYSSYRTPYVHGTEAVVLDEVQVPAPSHVSVAVPSEKPAKRSCPQQTVAPAAVVGYAVAAALMVLLLLTQAQLSSMSFAIHALETEITALEQKQDKLLIAHAQAYSPERVEDYAINELGMVRPTADQFIYIEIEQ